MGVYGGIQFDWANRRIIFIQPDGDRIIRQLPPPERLEPRTGRPAGLRVGVDRRSRGGSDGTRDRKADGRERKCGRTPRA
jgi:hypothetical protein